MAKAYEEMSRKELLADAGSYFALRGRFTLGLAIAGVGPVIFWAAALSLIAASSGSTFFYPAVVVVGAWGLVVTIAAIAQLKAVFDLLWFALSGTKTRRVIRTEQPPLTPQQEMVVRLFVATLYNTSPFALLGMLATVNLRRYGGIEEVEADQETRCTPPDQMTMDELGTPHRHTGRRVRVAMKYLEQEPVVQPKELVGQSQ